MRKIRGKVFKKIALVFAVIFILNIPTNFVAAENENAAAESESVEVENENVDEEDESVTSSSTDVSIGSFNVTNSDIQKSIRITEVDTGDIPVYLMPQQSYDIKVKLSYEEGLASIDSLEVKMWLDIMGNQTKESHFNDIQYADGAIGVRIKWNKSDNTVILDTGDDATWELMLEDCVLPSDKELSDPTLMEFEFVFRVKIGKVAIMTEGDSIWMLAYQTMSESGTVFDYYMVDDKPGLKMDWYCEVEAPTSIGWGDVMPGIDYEDENAKQRVSGVRYISNGKYSEQVKFDTDWKGKDDEKVAILANDPINKNEFALRVNNADNLESAKQIPNDGSFVVTMKDNERTTYQGRTRDDYYFYIKLNEDFDMGMYTGNITFGVSNEISE